MSNKTMIERELLEKIYADLKDLQFSIRDVKIIEKLKEITQLFDDKIFNSDKEMITMLKKMIYKRLKETQYKEWEKNKELFQLHLKVKDNIITFEEAINELELIENKYKIIESKDL